MKIALCFHGLPNYIEETYNDIYNYFIKDNDIAIFAHFWWDDSYKGKINRLHVKQCYDTNYEPINIFKKLYNPTKINVNECIEFDVNNTFQMEGWTTKNVNDEPDTLHKLIGIFQKYSFYSRYTSQYNVINMIDNKDDYDIFIILRSDLMLFDKNRTLKNDLNLNALSTSNAVYYASSLHGGPMFGGEYPNRVCDWFEIVSKNNIDNYNIIKKHLIEDNKTIFPVHNQERIQYILNQADLKMNIFNSGITIKRFLIEEWENPNYRSSLLIKPDFYRNVYEKIKDSNTPLREIDDLPFYAKYIKNYL